MLETSALDLGQNLGLLLVLEGAMTNSTYVSRFSFILIPYRFKVRDRRDMGDLNQSGVPNQADINAQLLAGPAQLTAAVSAMTEQLARLEQGNRPNGLRPRGRNHPYLADPQLTQTRTMQVLLMQETRT
ncbi:hypothetical protein F2Q70_00026261 [Brassica cretica]|uniref:Uncharacterized protein n=1 Tax=Brassica cretica TaxID=69181 RepID=A0A8S9L779_BRACR|nr:hypothetical protein F2Q70_00026261 [Brassica cretica]